MTAREVRTITQRLSLRKPQADSLELLDEVLATINLAKDLPLAPALAAIQAHWPQVQDFEHSFPSVCFNLATGVGKTRLMGAFIAYLCLTQRSQHFFVLAPNRTIYDKLIGDFTPGSPKYVFKGIAEFAQNPPLIITGENYESGIGVRLDGKSTDFFGSGIHVNIFNVDKINKEESTRGRPKMKRLQETIGDSYYNYLSGLKDLVVLMDEAHRYRASAGARAINELRPLLGLELTATPKTVGTPSLSFRNVIYSYTLGQAMADGFVKEPAVATRKDFDPTTVSPERLEQIKLEDGVHYHDYVSVELDRYHRISGRKKIHPFILVVAQDTDHARQLRAYLESEEFYKGRFKGRVIEIHSALRGEESEDATAKLVALEHNDETDIVIHVNKLKEGWDVTNLYTIVPLRASASEILTEQTLGRGLRLPYGERVCKGDGDEFAAVDRLTVIAHDRFDDIIKRAKEPGSIVMKTIEIGEGGDIPLAGATLVETPSVANMLVMGTHPDLPGFSEAPPPAFVFESPAERQMAEVTMEVIQRMERRLDNADALNTEAVQQRIVEEVRELTRPAQGSLEAVGPASRVAEVVQFVTNTVARNIISIPEIVVIPKRQVTFEFDNFDLADLSTINYRPTDEGLVVETLRTSQREYLTNTVDLIREKHPENYIVRFLIERDEIDYDAHAELLYRLAGQVVARLKSYLENQQEIENVLLQHGRQLAEFVFRQMMQHYRQTDLGTEDYEVKVSRGFTLPKPQPFNVIPGQPARDFRQPVTPRSETRRYVFGGFARCCYPLQKFDTEGERAFAALVDREETVLRWMKPGRQQFQIEYASGQNYEPDFVVETMDQLVICEIKAEYDLRDSVVISKRNAAMKWCKEASDHARATGSKPWSYALIPDERMVGSASLSGLISRYAVT